MQQSQLSGDISQQDISIDGGGALNVEEDSLYDHHGSPSVRLVPEDRKRRML